MNWINTDIMPADWPIEGHNTPRGPDAPIEAELISQWVATRSAEYGQALRFILSSGARINEALQLRADKVVLTDGLVELLGKGGRIRKIPVLHAEVLYELDLAERFVNCRRSGAGVGRMDWNAVSASVVTRWVFSGAECMASRPLRPASLWTSNAHWGIQTWKRARSWRCGWGTIHIGRKSRMLTGPRLVALITELDSR
jgi:hypothetical protein